MLETANRFMICGIMNKKQLRGVHHFLGFHEKMLLEQWQYSPAVPLAYDD